MTDWEQQYVENDTPWDKGEPSPGLVDFLKRQPLAGRILVPGCGLGHDVRAIAAASARAEVVGLDVAPSAVKEAGKFPGTGRERYVEGDLFALPEEFLEAFDWVWEHTCFCAIDPARRDDYVRAVRAALRSGGQLLAVFYLDPYDEEHRPGDNRPPHGATVEELEQRFTPFFEIEETWEPENTYPGREGGEWMARMVRK